MSKIIHIKEEHDYDVELNYLPYRLRCRSYSMRKLLIDQLQFSGKYSGANSSMPTHKYVRTFSPPLKKSSEQIFQKYIKSPKESGVAQSHKNRGNIGEGSDPQQYSDELDTIKNKVQLINKGAKNGKKGERLYTFNQNYDEKIPIERFKGEEQGESDNKIFNQRFQKKQQTSPSQQNESCSIEPFRENPNPSLNEEFEIIHLQSIDTHQRQSNKLEETTKSHLKSDFSMEDHKPSKEARELQYLIKNAQNKEKLQQIYENSHQTVEISNESKQEHSNSCSQKLQYSKRSSKKGSSKRNKKQPQQIVYTKLTDFVKRQNESNSDRRSNLNRESEVSSEEKLFNEPLFMNVEHEIQSDKVAFDEKEVSQQNIQGYSEHYPSSQQISEDEEKLFEEDEPLFPSNSFEHHYQSPSNVQDIQNFQKNSYKAKFLANRERSSKSNGSPTTKKQEEEQKYSKQEINSERSKHPAIFLKNKSASQPSDGSFKIAKIQELADHVDEHHSQSDTKNKVSEKYSSIAEEKQQKIEVNHPKIFIHPKENESEKHLEKQKSINKESYLQNSKIRENTYGKKYSKQKQQKEVKRSPQKKKANKTMRDKNIKPEVVDSKETKLKESSQQHPENTFPETQKQKGNEIQHIWSFSDLPSEELRRIENKQQNSNAFADYSSRYELSSILADENEEKNHCFNKEEHRVSQSFPTYLDNQDHHSPKDPLTGSKTVPLEHCSEMNSVEYKHSTIKLKNVAKSLEEQNMIDLIGQSDHMKELSSLAMESKEQGLWNQHHLKEELSRFLIANKILNEEENPLSQGQDVSSTFREEINGNSFHLDDALKEDEKKQKNEENSKEQKQNPTQMEQIMKIRDETSRQENNCELNQKELESHWIQHFQDVEAKSQSQQQLKNVQSMSSFVPATLTGNIYEFKNHFHPRKPAFKRFDHIRQQSISSSKTPVKTYSTESYNILEGYRRQSDSLSRGKTIELETGLIQKNRRLDKNLTRFKTRVRYY